MTDPRLPRDSAIDERPTIEHHRDETLTPGTTDAGTTDYGATPVATQRIETERTQTFARREPDRARGGFSFGSVLSGVVVAFGAFLVLAAIIGGILAATGVADGGISSTEAANAGLGAAIALVIAQFLAYLWGGYTAGRMARGAGVLNGLLVPVFAIILMAVVGAVVAALAANAGAEPPTAAALPLPLSELNEIGTYTGIGALVAMLLGGALGGSMGARWHTKLEDSDRVIDVG